MVYMEMLNHRGVNDMAPVEQLKCRGLTPMLCSNDMYRLTNDFLEQDCLRLGVCWITPVPATPSSISLVNC
jgi:hypothetical protein